MLGPMGRVLVHGGVGLLVSHLGGRRGEVLVALSETQKEGMASSTRTSWVHVGARPQPRVRRVPAAWVMDWGLGAGRSLSPGLWGS